MSLFLKKLNRLKGDDRNRRWLFVPYDQLSDQLGPLARENPSALGIILIENRWKAERRPYHKQKLAFVLSNSRHFALEQAGRGVAVRYLFCDSPYREALMPLCAELGPLEVMQPAERELRVDLQPLLDSGAVKIIPHEGWLTTAEQFHASQKNKMPWRMDAFYRHVRRAGGILMQSGKPLGGKFSFDAENRRPWKHEPTAPTPPSFALTDIKSEVGELIEKHFAHHPGRLDLSTVPATLHDTEQLWDWAKRECLPWFGPYEDAMSAASRSLFHTRLSPLLNLHRLLPQRVVAEVGQLELPLASREGFIRQILGWREYVQHVHEATDGFRNSPSVEIRKAPGDGGYQRWAKKDWPVSLSDDARLDGGAATAALGDQTPLPPAYWGEESGLACLDHVVNAVWEEGYSHHITRLMVLANLATLLDVSPRELTDWFWAAYSDAYDWVVEPNVLGMGTFALGDFITTKPYVSGAAYLNRMSDYCSHCAFDPKTNCPITPLYWAFLARHAEKLKTNQRLALALASMRKRSATQRRHDQEIFGKVREKLIAGEKLTPALLEA